jgi:hypothetical protein
MRVNVEGFMYTPRLLILPLLVSICVAQPVPGNVRKDRQDYLCIETEPLAEPPEWVKKLFPRPVLFQQLPAFRQQDGSVLTRIITPPEFRATRDLKVVDMSGVSLFLRGRFLCRGASY